MEELDPPLDANGDRVGHLDHDASGAPVHVGSPQAIGIADLGRPDYGDPVVIHPGEVPVFWACGVTPQAVALEARPELMITHEPGIMFLTGLPREGDSRS